MTLLRAWRARALASAIFITLGALSSVAWLPSDLAPAPAEAAVVPAPTVWNPKPSSIAGPSPVPDRDGRIQPPRAERASLDRAEPQATADWSGVVIGMNARSAALSMKSFEQPAPAVPPLALDEPTAIPTAAVTASLSVPPAATVVPPPTTTAVPPVVPVVPPPTTTAVPPVVPVVPPPTTTAVPTAVPVPTAVATPTSAPDVEPNYVRRGHVALAQVGFDPGTLGYAISFHPASSSYRGLTFTGPRRIEVYVRPSMSDADLAYVVAHEIGHAVDHIRNNAADRSRWRAARGMAASAPWWPDRPGSDLATPAGDFAECFASWAVGSPSHSAWGSCAGSGALVGELAYG